MVILLLPTSYECPIELLCKVYFTLGMWHGMFCVGLYNEVNLITRYYMILNDSPFYWGLSKRTKQVAYMWIKLRSAGAN